MELLVPTTILPSEETPNALLYDFGPPGRYPRRFAPESHVQRKAWKSAGSETDLLIPATTEPSAEMRVAVVNLNKPSSLAPRPVKLEPYPTAAKAMPAADASKMREKYDSFCVFNIFSPHIL